MFWIEIAVINYICLDDFIYIYIYIARDFPILNVNMENG